MPQPESDLNPVHSGEDSAAGLDEIVITPIKPVQEEDSAEDQDGAPRKKPSKLAVLYARWKQIKPLKRAGIWILMGLMTGCLCAGTFYGVMEFGKMERYRIAMELFHSGTDPKEAQRLLEDVVREDSNNEEAFAALAHLYRLSGNWLNESKCRQWLRLLNPLKPNADLDYYESCMKAQSFDAVYVDQVRYFMQNGNLPMSAENEAYFLISAVKTDHWREARERLANPKIKELLSSTERGRLAEFLFALDGTMTETDRAKAWLGLDLDKMTDPVIKFEYLNSEMLYLTGKPATAENVEKIEALLQKMSQVNPFVADRMLAMFASSPEFMGELRFR